jgi:chromosome segregation ATPase
MDIKQYQLDREKELQTFKTEYADLKTSYNDYLTQAINDPSKISAVLEVNKSLSDHVQKFIGDSQNKSDIPIDELTKEILSYQKEYQQISDSQQQQKTIKDILNKENSRLESIQFEFNIFLGILFLCIFIVIILIFKVPRERMISVPAPQ